MEYKNLKAIAFDLDGTLYSSETMIARSYLASLQDLKKKFKLSFSIPSSSDVIKLIGLPGNLLYQALVPSEICSYYEDFKKINSERMSEAVKNHKGELMEGVPELFDYLHSKKIVSCMASNGSLKYLNNIINTYHLRFYNPIISLNNTRIQTKSDILAEYLLLLGIKPKEMLMIGDRYIDLEAAKTNQIFFIGLKSGVGYTMDPKELENADLILDDISALHQFLKTQIET